MASNADDRVVMDCRTLPSVMNCSVTIAGRPDEVLELAVHHAVTTHGEVDSPELREGIRKAFERESTLDQAAE